MEKVYAAIAELKKFEVDDKDTGVPLEWWAKQMDRLRTLEEAVKKEIDDERNRQEVARKKLNALEHEILMYNSMNPNVTMLQNWKQVHLKAINEQL